MADWWNPLSWFSEGAANWLGGLGGDVASGIEGGFVAILKDIWKFFLPFAEIAVGALIAIFTLAVYFSHETSQVAGLAARAAMA